MNDVDLIGIAILMVLTWYFFTHHERKERYYRKNGIKTKAKVISIEKTIFSVGTGIGARPLMRLVLAVETPDAKSKNLTLRHAFGLGETPPQAGDEVNVLVDSKHPSHVLLSALQA